MRNAFRYSLFAFGFSLLLLLLVIAREARDLHFAANCRSLTSFGMTIINKCYERRKTVVLLPNCSRNLTSPWKNS